MIKPRIYNTLTGAIEEIVPLNKDSVGIYTCGPTIYENAHIGNLSSYIYADTLGRILRASLLKVNHAMNFTDVDDKTINKSKEVYPNLDPKTALERTTRKYEEVFKEDFSKVGCDLQSIDFYRATENIEAMKKLTTQLYEDKIAYIAEDGIYFSIDKYKEKGKKYGQLSKITAESRGRQRVNNDEYDKDNIHDFALWKAKRVGEPSWEYTLDGTNIDGRPGWHIECSAMSESALGIPFDIHTGGVDLIFPHHENEIAQSTAVGSNDLFAKYFFHNEHLLVDGKKMSKSLNNFYALKDLESKGFDPLAFRLLVLKSHYRTQSNFTWKSLQASQNRLKTYRAFAVLGWQTTNKNPGKRIDFDSYILKIKNCLADDLDTVMALTHFDECVDATINNLVAVDEKNKFDEFLEQIDSALGLGLAKTDDLNQAQKNLIHKREALRESKDFIEADVVRKELLTFGIEVRDTPHGTIWNPV